MRIFKSKFQYNPDSLQYEKVPFNFKRIIVRSLPHIVLSTGIAIVLLSLYMLFFSTPEEIHLRSENKYLKQHIEQMDAQLSQINTDMNDIAERDNEIYRVIYNTDQIPDAIRNSGFGGADMYQQYQGYESSDLVIDSKTKLDIISKKLNVQTNSYAQIFELAKIREKQLKSLPILQPVPDKGLKRYGSFFGYRSDPFTHIRTKHNGIDLTAPKGTPVYASGDAKVISVGHNRSSGYGNKIVLDHGINGITTLYAHLNTINVKKGQEVKRGELIGTVGNTGRSTAPHLHYEVRINSKPVDPMKYIYSIPIEEYEQVLELAKSNNISF